MRKTYFFIIGGSFMLLGGVYSFIDTYEFMKGSIESDGIVIDLVKTVRKNTDGQISETLQPVVQFTSHLGDTVTFKSNVGKSESILGKSVKIRYTKEEPHDARIVDSFMDVWGLELILGIAGLVCLASGFKDLMIKN